MGSGKQNRAKFAREHNVDVSRMRLAAGAASRHLRHALAVQIDLADAFYPREDIINSLAAEPHQFRAHDARYKIIWQIQNLLRRRAVEPLAKNGRHRASERLHFRAEGHADVCLALVIYVQINANCVGALLIFSHIDEIELLAFAWFLLLSIVCIRNERLAPLIFRQRFKKVDDLVQFRWIHRVKNLPLICLLSFRAKTPAAASPMVKAGGIACSEQGLYG
jgi:hypothetical protein